MTFSRSLEFYITNSILTQKSLYNIRRSGQQSEVITAYIALNTSRAQIDQLHAKLVAFVTKHSRDFQPKMMLFLDGLEVPIVQETQGKMRLKLIYFARSNFQVRLMWLSNLTCSCL